MLWFIVLNIGVTVLVLTIAGLIFHKVRKIHLASYDLVDKISEIHRESKWLYAQMQAFHSLDRLLQLPAPLPTLRGWAASPDFLLEIAKYVLEAKPETALECSSGCSTVVLARSMQLNGEGHVYGLEHDSTYAAITRRELERQGLMEWATIIDAPLVEMKDLPGHRWYSLESLPHLDNLVDMVVIDGPPMTACNLARYPAFPMLKHTFSDCCRIFLDDASRSDEKEIVARWLKSDSKWMARLINCEKGCAMLWKAQ
ncbi:MAG: class I SAM-dependent methyltransferase [Gammaproteobacteria bacterium]|nr:class I SAM-dependent methyltransferase [Gammaproteobacteria bacterium]